MSRHASRVAARLFEKLRKRKHSDPFPSGASRSKAPKRILEPWLTEGNEDHQGLGLVRTSLSYLRYLLFRISSVRSVLVVPAIRGIRASRGFPDLTL